MNLDPPAAAPAPTSQPAHHRSRWRWLGTVGLGLLGSLTGLALFTALPSSPAPKAATDVKAAVASVVATIAAAPPRSAEVYSAILPSLVYIRTEGNTDEPDGRGVGSGVIVNADGLILTAHHVVQGARSINVIFADGTRATAQVVATQPNDLAILRANGAPEVIVPAVLGGGVRIGDNAYAIGNPLGLPGSFSAGVVSGLNRSIPLPQDAGTLTGLIQFDAAVNPGSSGGPLLNGDAQVVGIVTALANPSNEKSFTGIGFAVPIGAASGGLGAPPR